jgi:hypothetical protein
MSMDGQHDSVRPPQSASEIPNASEGATATRTMIPSAATLMLCRANRADHVA